MTRLAELTTLRVGGPARRLVDTTTAEEFVAAIRAADDATDPLLVLGGGSNVLVADDGFAGTVVRDRRSDPTVDVTVDGDSSAVRLTAAAGVVWDDLVARTVQRGWAGVECLSGIPGSVGATPVQNVGAYGQEVSEVLVEIRAWDRVERRVCTLGNDDLAFGYRTSLLKRTLVGVTPRWVVLEIVLELAPGDVSAPVRYDQLGERLGVAVGDRVDLASARRAVLALRSSKGMVLDPDDHDTWSAGSFFTNPVLTPDEAARLPHDAPRWPVTVAGEAAVKTSAAWLIEQAGYRRGHGLPGPAALSTKHTLAVTNRGDATAGDLLALAREIRAGVADRFGIGLDNEPMLVGTRLDP